MNERRSGVRFLLGAALFLLGACGGPSEDGESPACAPLADCQGVCVDTSIDAANCGSCANVCVSGQECVSGQCLTTCRADEVRCDGECRTVTTDPSHCGTCGNACAEGQFCDQALCQSQCSGQLCSGANGNLVCAHLDTSLAHCGACGTACASGQVCENGACLIACAQDEVRCDGSCAKTQTDPLHCGSCNSACLVGEVCQNGACACPSGTQVCDVGCFDLQTDSEHCGSCDTRCDEAASCSGGKCVCAGEGLSDCDGQCTSVLTDPNHCGSCDKVCEGFEACEAGQCRFEEDGCGGKPTNISLTKVVLYQAVEVPLMSEGVAISTSDRNADVIQNRDAVLRAFVNLEPATAPKAVSLRVVLRNDDQETILFHRRTVSASSTQGELGSTFVIDIPAAQVGPTTTYAVHLADCGDAPPEGSVGDVVWPRDGEFAALDARKVGRVKLVFLPLIHDGQTPDTSDAALSAYAAGVMSQYPIEGVDYRAVPAVESGFTGINFDWGRMLDETVFAKRRADAPSADEYYYGLIKPTARLGQYCQSGCTAGIGYLTSGATAMNVPYRTALGLGYNEEVSWSTLPHELGHNHGRDHAPCGGVNDDRNYPYEGALIGSYGFDLTADALLDPTQYVDFMSYCSPTWISDYTFQALADRVAAVNEDQNQRARKVGAERSWWSLLSTSSGTRWSSPRTTEGELDHPLAGFVYDQALNPLAEVELGKIMLSDAGGFVLLVPPPEPGWYAVGIAGETPFPY